MQQLDSCTEVRAKQSRNISCRTRCDSALHKEAVRQGISCKDGLDLLDEMVDEKIIDVSEACGYLTSLGRGRPEVVMRRTGALLEKWYEKS